MNSVELIDFRELILAGDMKYLRFVEKNSNKLYLVEYYTDTPIEVTIENLNKLTTIDDVKNYFISRDRNTNIFEFIETRDLKNNINTIKEMTADEKKMLTTIVKEIKNYNISYINFTYFFVETQDRKLYYAKLSKKTNEVVLKNLKIEMVIIPADIDVIFCNDLINNFYFRFRPVSCQVHRSIIGEEKTDFIQENAFPVS